MQLTLFSIIAASISITIQVVRLKNQIENNTIESTVLRSRPATLDGQATTTWNVEVWDVSLGSTVLGLTWASTILMLVDTMAWGLIWRQSGKERVDEMKEEKFVQG